MKCDLCGNDDAVVFVQQSSGDKHVDLHLCAECAARRGISSAGGKIEFSVAGLLSGLFDQKAQAIRDLPPCSSCGTSLEEIQKTGKLGCIQCARGFSRELLLHLRKYSDHPRHMGRYPAGFLADGIDLQGRSGSFGASGDEGGRGEAGAAPSIERLRSLLKKAVADEDFETAAELRDRIKLMEHHGQA